VKEPTFVNTPGQFCPSSSSCSNGYAASSNKPVSASSNKPVSWSNYNGSTSETAATNEANMFSNNLFRKTKSCQIENNQLRLEPLEPRMMLSTVQLNIAGQTNEEIVDILVDDQVIATINNVAGNASDGEFVTYNFETDVTPSNFKVLFKNDDSGPEFDRNVRVQSVTIDGVQYDADAPDVFSTGTWRASDGCDPGFKQSQWLTCDGFLEFNLNPTIGRIQGESGASSVDHIWITEEIKPLSNPVIIVGPSTSNDLSPGVTQVRNVTSTSFDVRFKEWNYLDGIHDEEQQNWLALNEGRFQSADGSTWEIGKLDVSDNANWTTQRFTQAFTTRPYLFLTVQTQNGAPVVVRARNVSRGAFDVAIFEEQATQATGHVVEVVGYLAIEPGASSGVVEIDGLERPYLLERGDVNHNPNSVARFGISLQEEQSQDAETDHAFEEVNALAIGNSLFAQVIETKGSDAVTIRRTDASTPTVLQPGFVLEEVVNDSATSFLTGLEADANGRQYLVDQRGIVWLIEDGVRQTSPFLDIRDQVSNVNLGSGQMSGFALDPNFESNGFVYALYTTTQDGESFGRLTRFTRDVGDLSRALASSARILIGRTVVDGLLATNFHSQGDIEFGNDGSLLFTWGDSASNDLDDPGHFNSQNFDLAAGKLFRVNAATGRGLGTNPFFDGNRDSTASKTWAYGIRNGFRFDVQPGTGSTRLNEGDPGRIIIADVGRNRFEELNVSNGGENFGWPFYEGNVTFRGGGERIAQVGPAVALSHPDSRSVIGGAFVEGSTWPAELQGRYLAADFVEGWIRSFRVNDDGSLSEFNFATGIKGITDMVVDPTTGDILISGRGLGTIFGDDEGLNGLYRIRYAG
jgi:glucose/arabinose dehydrogenase